jgi:hypothetical protein
MDANEISLFRSESMATKPHAKHDVHGQANHRDAKAAFDIAARAWPLGCVPIGGSGDGPSAPSPGFVDDAPEDAYATA